MDDPLAPPRARLRTAHRRLQSHDPRRPRKPSPQTDHPLKCILKRTLSFAHDLVRKSVPTFRDHALMRRDRIVPLIIAVALFMENMDSTVIATSLPAIATDIGCNP